MPYTPVWKDTFVDFGAVDTVSFNIIQDSDSSVLYVGKAVRRPDEATLAVRVNDIVADLLARNTFSLDDPFTDYTAFLAGVTISGGGVTQQLAFINDWSYDYAKTYGAAFILSDPVNALVDSRQTLAVTGVFASGAVATITNTGGATSTQAIGITGEGTYTVDLSTLANLRSIAVGGKTWTVESGCRQWVLHYINAYGGWDSLLIRGGGKQTDSITRYDHRRSYDNTQLKHRGRINYLNEMTRTWELHTGWLTDGESARMHHVTESVLVYLEDVAAGQMYPVTVRDTSLEYKTYKNQGRRLVDYTVTVELAADRIRK